MKAIHLICHSTTLGFRDLVAVKGSSGVYISTAWILKGFDPQTLKTGRVYFHESSNRRAVFAARVVDVTPCNDNESRPKWALTLQRIRLNGQPWRGKIPSQNRHHGGIVDANFEDELADVG
jgi:hypothetical protein